MKKIIFATTNKNKVREVQMMMEGSDVELLTMEEAGINTEIVEDGTTFEENAMIKAKTIMEMTGEIALADDSGLEVDYLDGAPGIYSARFLGEETSYDVKNQYIIDKLKDAKGKERSARFVCAMAAAFPDGSVEVCRGTIEGLIGYEQKGTNGFGYDPIVYVPEYEMTTGEMTPQLKNSISHRGKALEQMMEILKRKMK
jgi:XTP/dITP diphosphohydrolase